MAPSEGPVRLERVQLPSAVGRLLDRLRIDLIEPSLREEPIVQWFVDASTREGESGLLQRDFSDDRSEPVDLSRLPGVRRVLAARTVLLADVLVEASRVAGNADRRVRGLAALLTAESLAALVQRWAEADTDAHRPVDEAAVRETLTAWAAVSDREQSQARSVLARWRADAEDLRASLDDGYGVRRLIAALASVPRVAEGRADTAFADYVLHPIEATAAILLGSTDRDLNQYGNRGTRFDPAFRELARVIRRQAEESRRDAQELRLLTSVIEDPFPSRLSTRPSRPLWSLVQEHSFGRGRLSPWLAAFLRRVGDPLSFGGEIVHGSVDDETYMASLAGSARASVINAMSSENPLAGESWGAFVRRLFMREWALQIAGGRYGDRATRTVNQEQFVALVVGVATTLDAEGWEIHAEPEEVAALWTGFPEDR